jgi:type VI secretion system secreted protein VgrG
MLKNSVKLAFLAVVLVGTITNLGFSANAAFAPNLGLAGTFATLDATTAGASQARTDLSSAFSAANGQTCDQALTNNSLQSQITSGGVYCFSGPILLSGDLQLSSYQDNNAVFIFKVSNSIEFNTFFTTSLLSNINPQNIFWVVSGDVVVNSGTTIKGSILATGNITLKSGATLIGRAYSLNGVVNAAAGTVNCPSCSQFGGNANGGTVTALSCAPNFQTVNAGMPVSFTAMGGNGNYTWASPTLTILNPNGAGFTANFATQGTQTVTVASAGQTATCTVNVIGGQVLGTNTGIPGLPNTGSAGEYAAYTLWVLIGGLIAYYTVSTLPTAKSVRK